MSKESAHRAARQIRSLYALGQAGGLSDPELIGRFLHRGGTDREDAFAALVQRHGPMVLGVCRRALPGSPEADDVFQAVFLVLARKAGSLRRVEGLRPWLYGVAVRASKEARRRSARRRAREGAAMVDDRAQATPDSDFGDALTLLDEEIQRLPSRYREPLWLCELEGASRRDAAGRLGVPEGTLSSRLSRARSLLREMSVSPEEAYAVYVDDKDWTATTRLDVVIREGKPASGIDFRLTRGSILRGTVTVGTGDKPSPGESVWLSEVGKEAPKELREPGDRTWRPARRQLNTMTDAQGRYSFRLGPGSYTLMGPARTKNEKITVQDEPELVRDFHMPRADKGPLSGRVVVAGRKGEGVAEASVEIVAGVSAGSYPVRIRADAEGRFRVDRTLDHCYVCAKSPDGSLGALVEIGAEDAEVVIEVAPTAKARGILLDEAGQAVVNREVDWGRRINFDDSRGSSTEAFATKVKTDALGRFTLPSLVIGQEYDISLKRDGAYYAAGVVRPAKAEAIDLGPLRAGSYRPPAPADAEEESSFRPDAPGAGVEAPAIAATTLDGQPLRLAVFCGKYVLLDFWATWCGPCIGEIPQLQAVHDAFGKDGRFAILSLSVDEKVNEPRAFQVKRKLPWAQGFVGGSVHGEVPGRYGVRAIPAFVLVGPDGRIIARGMRGGEILREVEKALGKKP